MKSLLISLLSLLIIANSCFSQPSKDLRHPVTREDFLAKSKNQRTAAWILLGLGVGSIAAVSSGKSGFGTTGTIAVLGGVAILSSVPLFLAAGRNKRKGRALSVFLNVEKIPTSLLVSKPLSRYPALTLKLNY